GTEIPLLVVTEGEKKSLVAVKNGFDCIGISGIWNFCRKPEIDSGQQDELMPSLKEFIKRCKVKQLVLLHDSDALDMSSDPKKSATDRPIGFFNAVKRFAELIFQEGVQFYYSYINPHINERAEKLGLDDLIQKYESWLQPVLHDFIESVEQKKYTTYFCTTKIEYIKPHFIKEIFHLNDPEDFYKYHKQKLKTLQLFRFDKRVFKVIDAENRVEEIKENNWQPIWIQNGRYYVRGNNGSGEKEISNFVMNVLFLLRGTNTSKRIVEVINDEGARFTKELTDDMLISVTEFRKAMIGQGCFIFKGSAEHLTSLGEVLTKEERSAIELVSLGYQRHHGFWAWSNGITVGGRFFPIDEYGIVVHNEERFYLPAFSSLFSEHDDTFENEKNFRYIDHTIHFDTWLQYFYSCYGNNGLISACWYVAALFRDIVYGRDKEFPLLNLFGQKGSGKSTLAKSLMYLFGMPQSAISLENASSTKKGMYRKFAQFKNAVIWLDEYKNSLHPEAVGMLKNLYDGIGYERAQMTQDNRTTSNPVHSSAILSGQDMPTIDPALFTRVILLLFKQNVFTKDQVKAYNELKTLEKKGMTSITNEILGHRELIEINFNEVFDECFEKISSSLKLLDIADRLKKNAAFILAPALILVRKKLIVIPCTENELFAKMNDILTAHKKYMEDNQELAQFWNTIEALFDDGIIRAGHDFKFNLATIAIRWNRFYTAYTEKSRKMFGKNGIDKNTLENYLRNDASFIEVNKSVRFDGGVSSAYIFKYKDLGINLERTQFSEGPVSETIPLVEEKKEEDLPY
ncbi:MAG: DUF3854 domain-containing protein, partial [Bacteroidia bacterium]